ESDSAQSVRSRWWFEPIFTPIGPPPFFAGGRIPHDEIVPDADDGRFIGGQRQLSDDRGRAKPRSSQSQASAGGQGVAERIGGGRFGRRLGKLSRAIVDRSRS